ncbi:MAG: ABC transporter substrate-binding protein [Gemmatimonadota bacterium]
MEILSATAELPHSRRPAGWLAPLFLLAIGACSGERAVERAPAGDGSTGGTAIVAFNAEMQAFNPLVNTDLNSIEVNTNMLFTPLIQYDDSFEPQPYLAADWELEPGGVTFHLNRDVRWHDGQPVTADDVKFTFDLAKTPETASVLSSVFLQHVESAEVIDSFSIRFDFSHPHARPLDGFWWPPVPKHLLSEVPPAQMIRADFNRHPVGSGPFEFVRWDAGESIAFERNPDFPESLGGPPKLDRLIIRFITEATTLLSETLGGRVDVNGSMFAHQAHQVESSANLRVLSYPSREYYYIGWNTRNAVLRDPRVRRALTMAIDRQEIIDALVFGHGQLASSTIAPWHPAFTDIEPLPHDIARAAALLAEAGWEDRDGDGVRENESGTPFRFTLMTNHENPVRVDIAQIVQAKLAKIGVAIDVRTLEWQTLISRHRQREFDGVVQSWVLDNFRVDPFPLFHSSQANRPGSYNRSSLQDPRVDDLIEAATRATDDAESRALWADFSRALQEAQPFTFLMWLDEMAAVSDRLAGVQMDARGMLVNVSAWWIPADRRKYAAERGGS